MTLDKSLNLLAEQQEEMLKKNELRAYMGLCMKEAALLTERSHYIQDEDTQNVLKLCANEAIKRAMEVGHALDSSV